MAGGTAQRLRPENVERADQSGRLRGLLAFDDTTDAGNGRDRFILIRGVARGFTAFRAAPAFAIAVWRKAGQRIACHRNQEKVCEKPFDHIGETTAL